MKFQWHSVAIQNSELFSCLVMQLYQTHTHTLRDTRIGTAIEIEFRFRLGRRYIFDNNLTSRMTSSINEQKKNIYIKYCFRIETEKHKTNVMNNHKSQYTIHKTAAILNR